MKRSPTVSTTLITGSYVCLQILQCTRHCSRPFDSSPLSCNKSFPLIAFNSPGRQTQSRLGTCSVSLHTQATVQLRFKPAVLPSELVPDVCAMLSLIICPLSPTFPPKHRLETGERAASVQVAVLLTSWGSTSRPRG